MVLPSLDESTNAAAEQRLRAEQEIWITTVRSDGQPQTSPVGFLWNGTSFLILSQPGSQKVRNLRRNAKVALHLDIRRDGGGNDMGILTLEGTGTVDPNPIGEDEAAIYVEKYQEAIRSVGMTPDQMFAEYSTVIRVTPTRTRSY
jgi:PPOX class probable F420-dependent enzyme